MSELSAKLDRILLQQEVATPETTTAALGESTLTALSTISGGQSDFSGGSGPAILTAEQQLQLSACVSEAKVVKFITPFLRDLRGTSDDPFGAVLVNSESFAWLDNCGTTPLSPNMRLKPDLFVSWRPFVNERSGRETETRSQSAEFRHGVLAHRFLQRDGAVRELYEAKFNKLTSSDLGELVKYHRLIPGLCRGMLFSRFQFWLYASYDGHPLKLVRCAWTAPGSSSLVCEFFDDCRKEPPLLVALRALTSALSVRLSAASTGAMLLGAGGFGRVFRVEPVSSTAERAHPQALKVVIGEHPSQLCNEFKAMSDAWRRGAPVVSVVRGSLHLLDTLSSGYLLSQVGSIFEVTSSSSCIDAFSTLQALHSFRVVHGDARLPNLLRMPDGKLAWIDLVRGVVAEFEGSFPLVTSLMQTDFTDMACSVLRCPRGKEPQSVIAAVAAYDGSSTTSAHVAAAVWAAAVGGAVV